MHTIGLLDCNNFFVSCERLFRPDLLHRPVVVLSSNDGCVIARSNEAKALGIPMGIPYFHVKDICATEKIVVFSSNGALYRDISRRVIHIVAALGTQYEVYSIDEAFFTVPTDVCTKTLVRRIRDTVWTAVGVPVSIGIASTKTIAKYANTMAKNADGIGVLDDAAWYVAMSSCSCGALWGGGGGRTAATLRTHGIHTAADIQQRGIGTMRVVLGIIGERLYLELTGSVVDPVGAPHEDIEQQSVTSSRSFAQVTTKRSELRSAVGYHTVRLAEKIRAQGKVAGKVSVRITPGRYVWEYDAVYAASALMAYATNDTRNLLKTALALCAEVYTPGVRYKKRVSP